MRQLQQFACGCCAIIIGISYAHAQNVQNIHQWSLDDVEAATIKLIVKRSGSEHTASAFIWGNHDRAVTALHAVTDSQSISVQYENPAGKLLRRKATAVRALNCCDLALIRIKNAPRREPLRLSRQSARRGMVVAVVGYPHNTKNHHRKGFYIERTDRTLRDLAPVQNVTLLSDAGLIDVDSKILSLDGQLSPGMSGAPIVTKDGQIVGIGHGGIAHGAAGISFAVHARHLEKLESSTDVFPSWGGQFDSLFVTPLAVTRDDKVEVGGYNFYLVYRRAAKDYIASADDRFGLRTILNRYKDRLPKDFMTRELASYQTPQCRAVIVVPAGQLGDANATGEVGVLPNDAIGVAWQLSKSPNPVDLQISADQFRRNVFGRFPEKWRQLEWGFPPFPSANYDGLVYQRQVYEWRAPQANEQPILLFYNQVQHGDTLVLATAASRVRESEMTPDELRRWVGAMICAQLTSISRWSVSR